MTKTEREQKQCIKDLESRVLQYVDRYGFPNQPRLQEVALLSRRIAVLMHEDLPDYIRLIDEPRFPTPT